MMDHDYGKCHVCGGRMEERLTNQGFEEGGEWVLIQPGQLNREMGRIYDFLMDLRETGDGYEASGPGSQ